MRNAWTHKIQWEWPYCSFLYCGEVLRISRKRRNPLNLSTVNPYAIDGHPLAIVPSAKDLGVIVNNKLTWSSHTSSVVAKANKTLRFLNRHFGFSFIGPNHRKSL